MIWQNPWAWLGLLSLALPVLIHLLSRRSAQVQPFPTLRFLAASRLQPVRRTRLRDILLLTLRMGILAIAVAALAQPLFRTDDRLRNAGSILSRAIVVDTSSSTARPVSGGGSVRDSIAGAIDSLVSQANSATVIETISPERAVPGAAAWLVRQPGTRELIVVSDFQSGTIDSATLAGLAPEIGIRLVAIDAIAPASYETVSSRAVAEGYRTVAEWRNAEVADVLSDSLIQLVAPGDSVAALAAYQAALGAMTERNAETASSHGGTEARSGNRIVIVHAGSSERERLIREARPVDDAALASLVLRVARDPLFDAVYDRAARSGVAPQPIDTAFGNAFVPIGRVARPIAWAARGNGADGDRLLFFPAAAPGTLENAALIRAILVAPAGNTAVSELDPTYIGRGRLRTWERLPVGATLAAGAADQSDARYLWLLVLLLLGLEWWMRSRRKPAPADGSHE